MFNGANMPTDAALARLSENDLIEQRKVALAAINEAKSNGQSTTELSKVYQILEAENERRLRNRSLR
ncbi:MAG: hypothetical protein ABI970_19395 [Chloroflexota bacterium]|nr:hypothetical protein [Anaerolineae bacterium]